jgi:hypothetical protein
MQTRRLKMYKKRAVRDKNGKLISEVSLGFQESLHAVYVRARV